MFLETTPPNTPLKIQGFFPFNPDIAKCDFEIPHIQLQCEHDGGPRRFDPTKKNVDVTFQGIQGNYNFITYRCRDCQTTFKTFAVLVIRRSINSTGIEVMKLGEYPPFSAPISSRIQKLLSESDLELYRKGARAEAQGLRIGAATYFRRIVEGQWQHLVKNIRQAAERLGEDLGVYDVALKETQFSKAVEMLKGAIPAKLLISGGQNPLTLLYQPLSCAGSAQCGPYGAVRYRETLLRGGDPMTQAMSEKVVQEIRRKARRRFLAEEKIRIVLDGLGGEESIATLCRREGLNPNLYYRWSKEFLEAGKKRLVVELLG